MLHTTVGVEWFMICSIPKNELIANNQFCRDGIASINWSSTGVYICACIFVQLFVFAWSMCSIMWGLNFTRKRMTWLHFVNLKNIFPLKTLGWMSTFNLSSSCTHICTTLGRAKKESCTIYLYMFRIWFILELKIHIERQALLRDKVFIL